MSEKQKRVARELMTTHGLSNTPEYGCWSGMKARCLNKNGKSYKNYGGRGIKVCDRWLESFVNFYEDMGKKPTRKHTLERIDNNLGYSPKNCRWATRSEQRRNQRGNVFYTYDGETMCLIDWSKKLNLSYNALVGRIYKLGWSFERAITTKVRNKKKSFVSV